MFGFDRSRLKQPSAEKSEILVAAAIPPQLPLTVGNVACRSRRAPICPAKFGLFWKEVRRGGQVISQPEETSRQVEPIWHFPALNSLEIRQIGDVLHFSAPYDPSCECQPHYEGVVALLVVEDWVLISWGGKSLASMKVSYPNRRLFMRLSLAASLAGTLLLSTATFSNDWVYTSERILYRMAAEPSGNETSTDPSDSEGEVNIKNASFGPWLVCFEEREWTEDITSIIVLIRLQLTFSPSLLCLSQCEFIIGPRRSWWYHKRTWK